jgi:hypothetical protein
LARITIRVDDALFGRIDGRARDAGTPTAAYCRDILERFEGTDPSGYHARFDELHATGIQTLAILAASVGKRAPDILEQGLADARRLLRERGLLDPEQDRE